MGGRKGSSLQSTPIVEMPRPPAFVRIVALIGSVVAMASALAVLGLAIANTQQGARLAYDTGAFEVMILVAGVFGIFVGLGRYRSGPALALACVAGTIAVGSLLGMLGSDMPYHGISRMGVKKFNGVSLAPFLDARLLMACVLGAAAAATVLSRRPNQSYKDAAIGLILGVPAVVIVAVLWSMRSAMSAWTPALQGLAVVFGGLVVLGFLAASVHMVVRAFELGGQDSIPKVQ